MAEPTRLGRLHDIGTSDESFIETVASFGVGSNGSLAISVNSELDDLLKLTQSRSIEAIIINISLSETAAAERIFDALRSCAVDVYLLSDVFRGSLLPRWHPLYGLPLTIIQRRPLSDTEFALKVMIDYIGSFLLLLLLLPGMALIAIAIKLDTPGPVVFRQPRLGYNNLPFEMFKFRTMYRQNTDRLAERQTSRHDPRVTPVGR